MIASMSVRDDMMPPSIVRLPEWPLFPDNRVPGGPGATAASNKERSNGTGTFHGPTDLTFPHMRPFRPTRPGANTATVLIIFPGGAYHNVARPTGGEGDTAVGALRVRMRKRGCENGCSAAAGDGAEEGEEEEEEHAEHEEQPAL